MAALGGRTDDAAASAWAALLKGRFSNPPLDAKESIKLYQNALPHDPDNAIIRYFLGLSYDELGESELALQAWRQASILSPAWVDPHVMMARTLVDGGRISEAAIEAQTAASRAPQSLDVRVTLAMVAYSKLEPNAPADEVTRLLTYVSQIQKEVPNEPQSLPVYAALLARCGQEADAASLIRAALKAQPPLPSQSLVKLAQISSGAHLNLESEISRHLDQSRPANPDAAFDRAVILATIGKPLDGLKFITAARDAAGKDVPDWDLAVVKYREAIGDPGVGAAWSAIADANPKYLAVQRAVLAARSAWSDRSLIDRTIERLRSLTGEEGIEWKLARARWDLASSAGAEASSTSGPSTSDPKDGASAAAAMMADVVARRSQPRGTAGHLVQALEKLGDFRGAADRLRTAGSLAPGDLSISLSLARVLQSQGKTAEARDVLDRVAVSPSVSPAGHLQVARLLSREGQFDSAIISLKSDGLPDGVNPERDLLLARLYQALGKTDQAAKLFDALLQSPSLNQNIIRTVAWFYASHGDSAQAQQALRRLDDLKLPPGAKELTLAAFDEDSNKPDDALRQYRAAVQLAPTDAAAWKALAGYQLRRTDFTGAAAAANQGLKNIPGNAELTAIAGIANTLTTFKLSPELEQLISVLSVNPTDSANAQTLNAVAASAAANESAEQLIDRLRAIASANPGALAPQMLLAQKYFSAGRLVQADEVATRAMQAMPTEAEPARVLAVISATAGNWDHALTAANEWRNRSLDQPMPADIAIADAKLHMNDAGGAIAQLSPYTDQAKTSPDQNPAVVRLYAQALAQSGQPSAAQAMLEPLSRDSSRWRCISLELAATTAKDIASATDWIDKVAVLAKPDSRDDQLALATAWLNIGQRFNDIASLTKAKAIAEPLADHSPPAVGVYLLLGSVDQSLNDLPGAEAAYRKALEMDPGQSMARNNLAYAILLHGGDLNEARQLAEKAVADVPGNSAYQDTLARIYAKTGNLDAAAASFQNALHNDAGNIEALIGLGDTQSRAGHPDKAAVTLDQVETLIRAHTPTLSDMIRQELDELRAAMKSSGKSASAGDLKP